MAITKREVSKGVSIIILAIGYSLVNEPIEEFLIKTFSGIAPVWIGLIILAIGAYFFNLER